MAEMDFGRGAGALCPLHPEQLATGTCTRCGNFMCDTCGEGGTQTLCPTCRERAGLGQTFPLSRDSWTVSALLSTCWAAFTREWVMISVGVLIVIAGSIVGQIASQILTTIGGLADNVALLVVFGVLGYLVSTVIQGVVSIGYVRMLFDVLQGQKADLARVFTQLHKVVPYLLTTLLIFVLMVPLVILILGAAVVAGLATGALTGMDWSALGSIPAEQVVESLGLEAIVVMALVAFALYIFPGMWLIMPLLLMQPELAWTERPTAMQTLRRTFAYARGQRMSMLGASLLGGVIVMGGLAACCVGMIPALGLFNLMMAGLYLTLRNGAEEV